MAYQLKSVTIRTDNSVPGRKMIDEVWNDVKSGNLPLLFDSDHNMEQRISLVSKYDNYESDENGAYDLSIMGAKSDFFEYIEKDFQRGKYSFASEDTRNCAQIAWKMVWEEQKEGIIQRAFLKDFESSVPSENSKDGKAHCYLYIAIK